MVGEVLEKYWK